MGASRQRILRQLLTEAMLLSLCGGALAVVMGGWLNRVLVLSLENVTPYLVVLPSRPDVPVQLAMLLLCFFSAWVFGSIPARRLLATDVLTNLKTAPAARVSSWSRDPFAPSIPLITAQIALSVVLLVMAGLLLRSVRNASRTDPGFAVDQRVFAELAMDRPGYDPSRIRSLLLAFGENIQALPGVHDVTLASSLPPEQKLRECPHSASRRRSTIHERMSNGSRRELLPNHGCAVLWTRVSTIRSGAGAHVSPVAIVDQESARRLWPGQNAIGRRIRVAEPSSGRETAADPGKSQRWSVLSPRYERGFLTGSRCHESICRSVNRYCNGVHRCATSLHDPTGSLPASGDARPRPCNRSGGSTAELAHL